MKMHPQAEELLKAMAEEGVPPLPELSPEEARAIPEAIAEQIGPGPDVADVRDVDVQVTAGTIGARVYEPVSDPVATVVYYHGGGWVIGSLDSWDALCRTIAADSGCRVVSVDYRLAPEHRFPAAADDAYDAFLWVSQNLAAGSPVVVAGDSAGGNLATVTTLRARDEGGPPIALQVLVYPVADHDFTTASYEEYTGTELILNREEMVWFWDHYLPDTAQRSHPHASPLRAVDHAGLPPAYVLIAEHDPLRDEGLAYAAALEAAGVPVTVRRYHDQIHAFFLFVNIMESANQAVSEIATWIRDGVGES